MTSGCNGLTNHLPFSKQPGAPQSPGERLLARSHGIALAAVHRQRHHLQIGDDLVQCGSDGEGDVRAPVRGFFVLFSLFRPTQGGKAAKPLQARVPASLLTSDL
jgi:hypothetical protein